MESVLRSSSCASLLCLLVAGLVAPVIAQAQNPPSPLVTQAIEETKRVTLTGSVHPLARAGIDQGAVSDSFAANRMFLMLKRPPEREAALRQFLSDVHSPGSTTFHKWLTPAQFGELFGPADSDIQAAKNWLLSHGFRVAAAAQSKRLLEFSGTAANVREAFHSEIHQYSIKGEIHYANASELTIPEAIASIVRGVSPINNFRLRPLIRAVGPASYSRASGKATPLFTNPGGSTGFYAIGPEDFATQYDIAPLYATGVNGSGQTIGIIGDSNIDISVVNAYRQLFGLSSNPTQVVIEGGDPGIGPLPGSDIEAYLDVELSGAVAPSATVNLYISNGTQVTHPIDLATIRAIEDNQASVLSVSLGECEAALSTGGNQMWAGLWEQAAAQGQTVFVASGDTGSAGCGFDGEQAATQGLGVNGIASTPWNVAVGGTDFYYANYASGPSSAAPYWNQNNDSSNGSLKAPLPEQPWDEPFGLDILKYTGTIVGGGGGPSNCMASTTDGSGNVVCQAGYAKPIWQTAPGVPNDGVRDLPDVSLFASTGSNLSAYAICTGTDNCVATAGSPAPVLLVGGTSASSPAMAGIMALVNQKFGRQGQANYTLYALARQQPTVFHDVTMGTNNVPCVQGTPNCSIDTNGDGLFSLQEYAAGPGYDLASGLGSVDANALVTNWNKISFVPTATTLSLSPTSIVHGTSVTFTANVAAAPGTGTPSGDIAISTTSGLPLERYETIPLSNGTANEAVGFFPGGTYQGSAEYGGDGVFWPSTSAPVSLTVTPEKSSIWFIAYGPSGIVTNNGAQGNYGEEWIFSGQPYGINEQPVTGYATGGVTFADGANSQEAPINSQGVAQYSSSSLSVGSHAITLSYAGDASYQASTVGPFTFTIAKGNPNIQFQFVEPSVPLGGNLLVDVVLGTGAGTPPTGNVSFKLGATTVTAPLVSANISGGLPYAVATTTFTNLQTAGSLTLSVSYAGDSNWASATATYANPIVVAASTGLPSSTMLAVAPSSISRLQSANFTATVTGNTRTGPAPTGTVVFYVNGQGLPGNLVQTGVGISVASPSGPVSALSMSNGSNQVVAVYNGDSVYRPSTSTPATVNVNLGTFSLSFGAPRIVIPSGQTGNALLNLNGIDGFNMPISLTCVPSTASMGCSVNPATPTVSGPTTATLTINAYTFSQAANLPVPMERRPRLPGGAFAVLALAILLALYRAARRAPARLQWVFGCCVFAGLLVIAGCGGGGTTITPPPPPIKVPTPAGTYSVLVTATANGTMFNAKLIVVVQ